MFDWKWRGGLQETRIEFLKGGELMEMLREQMHRAGSEAPSFIGRLRSDSASEWAATLDSFSLIEDEIGTTFDHQKYKAFILKMYGFYTIYESEMDSAADGFGDFFAWDQRKRLPALRYDLEVLGFSEREILPTSKCSRVPRPSSIAQSIGMMFAMENLGRFGFPIGLSLKKRFGEDFPAHFFCVHGSIGMMALDVFQKKADVLITTSSYPELLKFTNLTLAEMQKWINEAPAQEP